MKCMVTGVSRGIGHAIAMEMLSRGHFVWGLSRTLPSNLPSMGGKQFRHTACDLSDGDARVRAGSEMDAAGFVPDVVVLNAAVEYEEGASALSWDKMQHVFRTNVEGSLFWVCHWMDRSPIQPMQFIGISSLLAIWPDPDCPAYGASKSTLAMAFRALRLRYARQAVSFKLLFLGPVHTTINPRFNIEGPPSRGVVRPEAVARFFAKSVLSGESLTHYYPWTAGVACRFFAWMPDRLFEVLTRALRR